MNFHLKVWRQKDTNAPGTLEEYEAENIPAGASFLEMLDIVNAGLTRKNIEPIQFDSDCREGICGTCSLTSRIEFRCAFEHHKTLHAQ